MPSNLPVSTIGDYCATLQDEINTRLSLRGGVMSGSIDLGGNDIIHINRVYGATHYSSVDHLVTSSSNSSTDLNIAIFDSTSGRVIKDSGVQISSISGALLLTGGIMIGSINLNGNSLTNVSIISGPNNSRTADNIVSNSGTCVSGNVATFSGATGKIITDGGVALSTLATTSALASYLPLAGGTMSGNININGNSLTSVGTIAGPNNSRAADNVVSNSGASVIGRVATFAAATGKVIQDGGVLLSNLLTISSAASTYLALTGGTMSGVIDSATNLNLGTNIATSVNIGRSLVVTTVNGIFTTQLPKAAWYSLAGTSPSFTANVFRAIPLLVDNSQGLVDFTINNVTGNLTYTGIQPRTFVYTCNLNISFTSQSTLSITVNKNSVTGFTNNATGLFWDVSIVASRRLPFHISDQVTLATGDTLILVGRWGNTSASQVTFGRCSFQIAALPN